jgi:hypothetical protein
MVKDLKEEVFKIRDELDIKGFYLISDFLKEEEVLKFVEFGMIDEDYISIFAHLSKKDNDHRRGQKHIKSENRKVYGFLKKFDFEFKKVFEFWEVKNMVILRSFPNGVEQELHCDFPLGKCLLPVRFPAGCIVAIQDNTKLKTKDFGIIEIPKYSALVFKGNFEHGGCSYEEENIRIHFNLKVKDEKYENDAVGFIDLDNYFCPFCRLTFKLLSKRKDHVRCCKHPDNYYKKEFNEKRKVKVKCELCGKEISKNNYKTHQKLCFLKSSTSSSSSSTHFKLE